MARPEIGLGEEGEDAADDADDVSRAAVVEDPGELERRVGHQLEQRNDLPALSLGCFGGWDDVVAEEVGEDLAELDLEVRGARGGAGGGGGGGGDELAELVDVGEVAGHRRRRSGAAAEGFGGCRRHFFRP